MMTDGYPFIFQMIDRSGADQFLIETYQVNVLFSATPHLPAVYQPVMWITQKK